FKNKGNDFLGYAILGMVFHDLGEYSSAERYHKLALELAGDLPNNTEDLLEQSCLNNLGYNLYVLGEYPSALAHFRLALKAIKRPEDAPELYAVLLDNIAACNLVLGKNQKCLHNLQLAADIRERYQIVQGMSYNKLLFSKYFDQIGDSEEAFAYAA